MNNASFFVKKRSCKTSGEQGVIYGYHWLTLLLLSKMIPTTATLVSFQITQSLIIHASEGDGFARKSFLSVLRAFEIKVEFFCGLSTFFKQLEYGFLKFEYFCNWQFQYLM